MAVPVMAVAVLGRPGLRRLATRLAARRGTVGRVVVPHQRNDRIARLQGDRQNGDQRMMTVEHDFSLGNAATVLDSKAVPAARLLHRGWVLYDASPAEVRHINLSPGEVA